MFDVEQYCMLMACVDKLQYMVLYNAMYHVEQLISVDQRIYWYESTPPKLPDDMFISL